MGIFSGLFGRGKREQLGYVLELSDGLRAFGQREIAIAVRLRRGEADADVRQVLRSFLDTVRSFAAEGRLADEGGLTEFGPRGFLDPRVRAIAYGTGGCGAEADIPADALVGVLLFADELAVARSTSVARVLARLGEATHEYPFPAVSDRDRPSVASPRDAESVLAMVARISIPTLSVVMENDTVVLSARPGVGPVLEDALAQLPDDAALALLTGRAARASGILVWRPGQSGPAAITPPDSTGTALSGAMLMVATGQDSDRVQMQEDGFALLARDETWRALGAALIDGTAYELAPTGDGLGLRVEHLQHGQYVPAGGIRGAEEIVLLAPDETIRRAIGVEELSAYIKQLIDVLHATEGVELRIELSDGPPQITWDRAPAPELDSAVREVEAPHARMPVGFLIRKPQAS